MSYRPTVLVYGHDGLDPDVSVNLLHAYRQAGCRPFLSRRLVPADVVCVERTPCEALDLSAYRVVHVLDYACQANEAFLRALQPHPAVTVFFPSARRRDEQLASAPGLARAARVLLPPVAVPLWRARPRRKRDLALVHVGNFKPYYRDRSDPYATALLDRAQAGDLHLWGQGWEGCAPPAMQHGKAALRDVSGIYADTRVALGMMYPYQRNRTISGRFWHAPLNGALLLSEAGSLDLPIPGVLHVPELPSPAELERLLSRHDADAVARQAQAYWSAQALDFAQALVTPTLRGIGRGGSLDREWAYLRAWPSALARQAAQALRRR